MELKCCTSFDELLENYSVIHELYPDLSLENYSKMLHEMIPQHYKQVAVYDKEVVVGVSGYWIGTKLWCGRYLEIDNFIVAEKHRKKGVAKLLIQHLEHIAELNNCKIIALDAFVTNYKAHRFYYDQGFAARGYHFVKFTTPLN